LSLTGSNFDSAFRQHLADTPWTGDMSKKKLSAEQRTLRLKEQLFAEELDITEDLVQSLAQDVGGPLDESAVNDILSV